MNEGVWGFRIYLLTFAFFLTFFVHAMELHVVLVGTRKNAKCGIPHITRKNAKCGITHIGNFSI
jgi:hypothetical protein